MIQEVLLGPANVSNIFWHNLGETFLTAELDGRLANIFADLPSRSITDSSLFKSITGEDWLTAQRKNKDPHAFKTTARLVFSCNSIPKNIGDGSSVLSFVEELCVVDAAAQASSTQIYHAYTQYCRDGGLKPVSQKRFGTELGGEVAGLEKFRESRTRRLLYKGIMLNECESYDFG